MDEKEISLRVSKGGKIAKIYRAMEEAERNFEELKKEHKEKMAALKSGMKALITEIENGQMNMFEEVER